MNTIRITAIRVSANIEMSLSQLFDGIASFGNSLFGLSLSEEELEKVAALRIVGEGVTLANGELVAERIA